MVVPLWSWWCCSAQVSQRSEACCGRRLPLCCWYVHPQRLCRGMLCLPCPSCLWMIRVRHSCRLVCVLCVCCVHVVLADVWMCVCMQVKVLSCSYFVYSIGGSCLFGVTMWWLLDRITQPMFAGMGNHSTAGLRFGAAFFGVVLLLAFVAYRAEQNEAPVLRVPKKDCT